MPLEGNMGILKNRLKNLNDQDLINENDYLVYWMQASQRIHYNHALYKAITLSNKIKKPLVVYFVITDNFPEANARHYHFMLEGILEVKKSLENINIPLIIEKGKIEEKVINFSKKACCLITDRGYLKIQKKWRENISKEINCQMIQVESDVVVPVEIASNKEEYAAYTLRKKISPLIEDYLIPFSLPELEHKNNALKANQFKSIEINNINSVIQALDIDFSVKKTEYFEGGYSNAKKLLNNFIKNKLSKYSAFSNDPSKNMTSNMSPYLHFGQISPIEVAFEIKNSQHMGQEDYLEQLIVRRELAINFIYYNENYNESLDSFLHNWVLKTMDEHINDPREYVYSSDTFESASTHDQYWNAAQLELVKTGDMHNYMRMYWGKKVIEWSTSYQKAFDLLVYLNNKYALDGRDANSFTGIAWCFGKHDRAWTERTVYGKLRYMNANGLQRKFDIHSYVKRINEL
jgi:deoxyribodipyrimidine photo-lyase